MRPHFLYGISWGLSATTFRSLYYTLCIVSWVSSPLCRSPQACIWNPRCNRWPSCISTHLPGMIIFWASAHFDCRIRKCLAHLSRIYCCSKDEKERSNLCLRSTRGDQTFQESWVLSQKPCKYRSECHTLLHWATGSSACWKTRQLVSWSHNSL